MVVMKRRKDRSTSPQSSTSSTGTSTTSSTTSSSSSSSSSSDSSSSDTEQSSAVSTRSRPPSRAASADKDAINKPPSTTKRAPPPPSSKGQSSSNSGGPTKKVERVSGDQRIIDSSPTSQQRLSTRGSSESEPEGVSISNRRGPKTSATSVPKNSNSSTAQRKPSSSSSSKSLSRVQVAPPPQNQKVRTTPSRRSSTSSVPPPRKPKGKKTSPVVNESKKKKNASIFSPENSSDSEIEPQRGRLPKSGSTKKVSPQKAAAKSKVTPSKTKKDHAETPNQKRITRKSSDKTPEKSSETSTNSSTASSDSDSESTSGSTVSEKNTTTVKRKERPSSETEKEGEGEEEEEEEEDDDEEGDGDTPRRLVTRSSTVKTKRSSLLGINKGTDSDSENGKANAKAKKGNRSVNSVTKKQQSKAYNGNREEGFDSPQTESVIRSHSKSGARSKTKKQPIQKVKNNIIESTPLPPIEQRNCPVDGCDSTGHLGGCYERHFTVEACPIFHNMTKEQCKLNREIRKKDMEERSKSKALIGSRSPRNGPSAEQKNYCNKIRDSRDCMSEKKQGEEEIADSDRQPSLGGLTPDWDLKLFLQAQSVASEKIEDEMKGLPDTKGIRFIQMGHYEMEAWYQSQYPEDYNQQPKIYVCEFCLKYMRSKTILNRHAAKCVWKHPPGDEIYRKDKLSVWEVDGTKYKSYCQNLCLLAMLFLDHKTLYYDVEPFLFYIMSIADSEGCHIIGYFSKEKNSFLNYNVSCIMTLPPYQRKGFGRLLIDFSYLLTKEEGKIGSPEKPLSDLGLISYRSYWKDLLLKYLSNYNQKSVCIKDISTEMAVNSYDIVSTFQAMGMMKYWKGKHILLKRQDLFEGFQERQKRRRYEQREIVGTCLDWRPYVAPPSSEEHQTNNNNNNNNNSSNNNNNNSNNNNNNNSSSNNNNNNNNNNSSNNNNNINSTTNNNGTTAVNNKSVGEKKSST